MKTSESTIKLDEALAKAQGDFTNPEKNRNVVVKTKSGGEYNFDYATFDSIIDMARPILAKHGISVTQFPSVVREHDLTVATVVTRIAHAGEWMLNEVSGVCESGEMQKLGSAFTYLCRYSYSAMLGIAAEYDDDGNAASGNDATTTKRAALPPCPKCSKTDSVIVGKAEYGGGLVCFAKKGGCGHKWQPAPAPLSDEEVSYVAAATSEIVKTSSAEELLNVGEQYKDKSEAVRNALRGIFDSRLKELRTRQPASSPA